jgi:hypothetical protein
MLAHDAEYFRQRRRPQRVLSHDPLSAPRCLKHGAGLRRLEQLPWPRNLFGENATIAELMTEAALIEQGAQISDELCPCGCRREHQHRVSQTLHNPCGRGCDITSVVRCLQEQVEPRSSGESPPINELVVGIARRSLGCLEQQAKLRSDRGAILLRPVSG